MSNLPANIINMAKGLEASADTAGTVDGAFLKFTKFGDWSFGAEEVEPEGDSQWVVHPAGFQHGWISWGDKEHGNAGEKLGEKMAPAVDPMPLASDLPAVEGSWTKQVSMQLRCLSGADLGVNVIYNTNSMGGRKIYSKILRAILAKVNAGEDRIAPVLCLGSSSYKHKTYGPIYTPEADVVDWLSIEELEQSGGGVNTETADIAEEAQEALPHIEEAIEEVPEVKAEVEEAKEVKTAQRRRRKATGNIKDPNPEMTPATPEAVKTPKPEAARRVRRVRG